MGPSRRVRQLEGSRAAPGVVHTPWRGSGWAARLPPVDLASLGAITQGLLTLRLLKGMGLRPELLSRAASRGQLLLVRPGVYAARPLEPLPRYLVTDVGVAPACVRQVRAVLLSLGGRAAARGRTAAALHGWAMLVEPARIIEVAVPHGKHRPVREGVGVVQQRGLEVIGVTPVPGQPLLATAPVPTVVECALTLPLLQAVVVADSALRAGAVTVDQLLRATESLRGRRNAARVRRVVALCDPDSGSVLESVLRVRMALDGIGGFTTQQPICDRTGQHVLRVDFCFSDARLVVEVDGQKWHQDPVRDQGLDNALAALGWRVLRYTWAEVVHDPGPVLAQIRSALDGTQPLQLPLSRPRLSDAAAA